MKFWKEVAVLFLLVGLGISSPVFGTHSSPILSHANAQSSSTTFTVGFTGPDPDTLNPNNVFNSGAIIVRNMLYDSLLRYNTTLGATPDLAQSWTVSPDGKTYTFPLYHNATWHDGVPVTANDVAFTYNFEVKNQFPQMTAYVANVVNATALDNYTVQINMKTTDGSVSDFVAPNVFILPQHIWANLTSPGNYTNDNPIGSGPFIFQSWIPGQEVDAIANPNYFGGAPHVQKIVFKEFTSPSSMVLALENGEIDLAGPNIPPATVPTLTSDPNIKVITSPDVRYWYFNFNQYPNGTGNPTLRDRNVRLALMEAMNTTELAQIVYNGFAQPGTSFIPPALRFWHDPNIPDYGFNLTASAKLLNQSGYNIGSDGTRASPTGTKMSYTLYIPSTEPAQLRAGQQIAQWWSQIGVKATPELIDDNTLLAKIANYSQDMFIWDWIFAGSPNPWLSVFLTSQLGILSDSGYINATYDHLYQQQLSTTNLTERQRIVFQMQQMIHNDVTYGVLYYNDAIEAYRTDKLIGFVVMPGGPLYDWNTYTFLDVRPIGSQTTVTQTTPTTTTPTVLISTTTTPTVLISTTTTPTSTTTSIQSTSSGTGSDILIAAAGIIIAILVVGFAIAYIIRRRPKT